ncbi:MAG: RNA polymerase sigma factor [Clostridia bacterium]|nr:RNA polymerase sigma factor [Clostridia bacterium]
MNSDLTLVEKALGGDTDAFSKLVDCYQHRLLAFTYKMVLSKEDAEEIVQETFIKAYKHLWRYDSRISFSTWLYTIAHNLCKTFMKRRKAPPISLESEVISGFEPVSPPKEEPSEYLMLKEYRREAHKLMAFLKPDQKAALILKYLQDLSYEEIGRILGISEDAAKMKVYRAKKEILKRYQPVGGVDHVMSL